MHDPLLFDHLLRKDVQRFIKDHEKEDQNVLVLKHKEILGLPSTEIAQQIVGRRKARTKLPLYYSTKNIIYPPKLNLEQCSSDKTAQFKASIRSGKLAADLTGGFGIDSYFLSKNFKKVIYIEHNEALLQIAKHNHNMLDSSDIYHQCTTAESFLNINKDHFDLLYIDPSRRSNTNQKVFKFSECSPDVVSLLPALVKTSKSVLIKASPLIDIKQGLTELGYVAKVFVVGFDNECKEVLFLIGDHTKEPIVEVVDLSEGNPKSEHFTFSLSEEKQSTVSYDEPLGYLYEPTAMMLKAGAFKLVAKRFDLRKLSPNTHLYTTDKIIPNFPGRIFKIECFLKSDSKSVHKVVKDGQANIISRNYPLSPSQLKKKLKLKDGGDQFVIAFSGRDKKYLVLASRVK
ncbi:MAG TPA: class I SAM-dependent methyltransferase [Cyclobacteriaceae bacterium]|nr:class I SAM-dependent methyltransferase [Cyclobacteriaceae bacterium]